jgi:hypothetical protein
MQIWEIHPLKPSLDHSRLVPLDEQTGDLIRLVLNAGHNLD